MICLDRNAYSTFLFLSQGEGCTCDGLIIVTKWLPGSRLKPLMKVYFLVNFFLFSILGQEKNRMNSRVALSCQWLYPVYCCFLGKWKEHAACSNPVPKYALNTWYYIVSFPGVEHFVERYTHHGHGNGIVCNTRLCTTHHAKNLGIETLMGECQRSRSLVEKVIGRWVRIYQIYNADNGLVISQGDVYSITYMNK